MLGWRQSNGTMQSQVSLNIGRRNTIRPDIVLYKNDLPVLPIEIKRPSNSCNGQQEQQLMSYMRQLRLNVGLYIGENIQLFYDNPADIKRAQFLPTTNSAPISGFNIKGIVLVYIDL